MALETGTYIDDLVATNPVATDDVSEGDDHVRLLKSTIQASFPNIAGAMTASHTELNILDGATVTTAELNQIDTGQFAFPATQNPSADVNTLDDYEEGTFTPTIQDNTGSDAEGQTYSVQDGFYVKIGGMVHFTLLIGITSLGTLTGTDVARIAGLPFANVTGREWAVHCGRASSLALPAAASVAGTIRLTNTYIELTRVDSTAGTDTMQVTHVSAGAVLQLSGSYQAA